MMQQTPFHAYYTARILDGLSGDQFLLPAFASSSIEIYPYQIAAAGFALRSPYLKGCILGDECSLGKTYEALLIVTQKWYEGKNRLLLVLPVNMVDQWIAKIRSSFTLPYFLIDTREIFDAARDESENPFEQDGLVITTYEFAVEKADRIKAQTWDLIIFDEADRLNKAYTGENKTATTLKAVSDSSFKLLLTPTPIEMDVRDIYGLIYFIDETMLPDNVDEFYNYYFRRPDRYPELAAYVSQFCFRTLKSQVSDYVNFTERIPYTIGCNFAKKEKKLYDAMQSYFSRPQKVYHAQINQYDLTLQHNHILSSSPQAYLETIKGVIGRAKKMTVPEGKQDLYNEELKIIEEIRTLAKDVKISGKMETLLTVLKKAFARLKQVKANQKAIVFVNFLETMDALKNLLTGQGYSVLTYSGENSRDYSVMKRFRDDDVNILIAKGDVTKGLDIEFCPIVVNYDILSNAPEMEQRISRSHRQGQQSDVLVINLVSKDNYADVRYIELINKRVSQFSGIFGMSDTILGNFDTDVSDVLDKMRHTNEIAAAFEMNLSEHEQDNRELVSDSLDTLFTTFTKEIADKITIAPQYIENESNQLNADLWDIVKWWFEEYNNKRKDVFSIDAQERVIKLQDGVEPPHLFYYNTGSRNKPYKSLKLYGMGKDFKPQHSKITLSSIIGRGIIKDLECADEGSLTINAAIEPCTIALYHVEIRAKSNRTDYGTKINEYFVLVGETESGCILADDECKRILDLPVSDYSESSHKSAHWLKGTSTQYNKLDKFVPEKDLIDKCTADLTPAQADEVERIKLRAKNGKSKYEREFEDIKKRVENLQTQAGKTDIRIEKMKLEKQLSLIQKDFREKEENLFLSGMRLDAEAERQIEEFLQGEKLTARTIRQFILKVRGK